MEEFIKVNGIKEKFLSQKHSRLDNLFYIEINSYLANKDI